MSKVDLNDYVRNHSQQRIGAVGLRISMYFNEVDTTVALPIVGPNVTIS